MYSAYVLSSRSVVPVHEGHANVLMELLLLASQVKKPSDRNGPARPWVAEVADDAGSVFDDPQFAR